MSVTNQDTDITWRYIDRRAAAVNALRDYQTMEAIIASTPDDLKAIKADVPGLSSPRLDGSRGCFNPHASEDQIIRHMERIDNRTRKYLQAKDYMDWFNPAWEALTDEERWMLEVFYLSDDDKRNAIEEICYRFSIERSSAYNKKNRALERFAALLYGR